MTPQTLTRSEVSELGLALAEEIQDTLRLGEIWEVCERYLDLARMEGPR